MRAYNLLHEYNHAASCYSCMSLENYREISHGWIFCFLSCKTQSSTWFSIACSRFSILDSCRNWESWIESRIETQKHTVNLLLNGTVRSRPELSKAKYMHNMHLEILVNCIRLDASMCLSWWAYASSLKCVSAHQDSVCMSYLFVNSGVMCAVIKKPIRIKLMDWHTKMFLITHHTIKLKTVIWHQGTSLTYSNKIHSKV